MELKTRITELKNKTGRYLYDRIQTTELYIFTSKR